MVLTQPPTAKDHILNSSRELKKRKEKKTLKISQIMIQINGTQHVPKMLVIDHNEQLPHRIS